MNTQSNRRLNNKLAALPLATSVVSRRRRRQRRQTQASLPRAIAWETPSSYTGQSGSSPGRACLKSVVEVVNGHTTHFYQYASFNNWFGQARQVLTPYKFFRIVDVKVEAMVDGGAASSYSIAFNASNAYQGDTNFGAVMNDDYAGLCTALTRPVLHPPRSYWRDTQMNWYLATDPDAGNPTSAETVAGCSSIWGSGGETPTTIVGWLVYTMEIEYHTLV